MSKRCMQASDQLLWVRGEQTKGPDPKQPPVIRHYLPDARLDTRRLFQCAAEDLRELDMLVPLSAITRYPTRLCL